MKYHVVILSLALGISACTTTDEVVFVTKSSLTIAEVDSTPAEVSVGYNRVEGYMAPTYKNGAIPPVIASIRTDGGLLSPEIKQLYATGDAANILASGVTEYDQNADNGATLAGERENIVLFGTQTNLGFKVGVTGVDRLPTITIGYKRKEASYIPLGTKDGVDHYPSVLATIDSTINANSADSKDPDGLKVGQFFATGTAAKHLATEQSIRNGFISTAANAFVAYETEINKQNATALKILRCASSITDKQWPEVIKNAEASKLLSGMGSTITKKWDTYIKTPTQQDRQQALKYYYSAISVPDGSLATYGAVLEAHKNLICKLAKEANNA